MLSVLAVAKRTWHHNASFILNEHLTKDFVKTQEIICDCEKVKNEPIRSDSKMCDFIRIIHNLRSVRVLRQTVGRSGPSVRRLILQSVSRPLIIR